ncbi:hypothetical protein LINGRAHAP2_LOCUS28278, partial [Linum grandiflorum]
FLHFCSELKNLLPGRPAADIIPPSTNTLPAPNHVLLPDRTDKVLSERQVAKISQAEEISSQVLALRQPLFIHVQHFRKLLLALLYQLLVCFESQHRCEHHVKRQVVDMRVEVVRFDFEPLLHHPSFFYRLPQQICPLRPVLLRVVPYDR